MRKNEPYERPHVEHEGNINDFRLALGLTYRELADRAGCWPGEISSLNAGLISPIDRNGKPRPTAQRLMNFFGCSIADLFPRYVCDFSRKNTLTDDQVAGILHGRVPTVEDADERMEIEHALSRLPARLRDVLVSRFFRGETLEEIGLRHGITREWCRQIERTALQKMKKYLLAT